MEKGFEKLSINDSENENGSDIENITIEIQENDAILFLESIANNTVDLVLTDPPYIISKESGMNTFNKKITESTGDFKTEKDWEIYSKTLDKPKEEIIKGKGKGWSKENYIKYGNILGKKYSVKTDYGSWDKEFTIEYLEKIVFLIYQKLRKGGTVIIWFDFWKITILKDIMEKAKFKQLRIIEWLKTNPQPINSKVNYLSNAREIAILGVKAGKPTFNSKYDKGVYEYPIFSGKNKIHPTQKSYKLFTDLIEKHSNEGDLVIDPFLGGGTTAIACQKLNRNFKGCDISKEYIDKVQEILD